MYHLTVMNIHMDDRDQYLNGRRVICERCMAKEGMSGFPGEPEEDCLSQKPGEAPARSGRESDGNECAALMGIVIASGRQLWRINRNDNRTVQTERWIRT